MASSISWPVTMPKPLQSGFSMQPEDRRIASSTVGTSFQKGFGGDVCVAECTILLSPLQARWFEKWERDSLVHGTRWFSFPVWYAGQVHWEDCRFKTRPKASGKHGFYMQYQFSLYVRRRTELMPDCMAKLFACFHPCFFFELIARLKSFFGRISNVTTAKVNSALAEIYED